MNRCASCPVKDGECLGVRIPRLCELAATRADYRQALIGRVSDSVTIVVAATKARLALIAACESRGSVLPHPLQPECGCAELTECNAGKGAYPGRVTLKDCLDCISNR